MILNIHATVERLRSFLTLIALLLTAAVISAPAAARGMHGFSHAAAPVASGEHHHHGADGEVTTHGGEDQNAPKSDGSPIGQIGHSHLAGTACDALPQPSRDLLAACAAGRDTPLSADTPALGTLGWSPQKRPPRTA